MTKVSTVETRLKIAMLDPPHRHFQVLSNVKVPQRSMVRASACGLALKVVRNAAYACVGSCNRFVNPRICSPISALILENQFC